MDNFFKNCPPVMSDARIFTDHRMATTRELTVKNLNNIVNNDQYRLFMMANGEEIMDNTFNVYKNQSSCFVNECAHNYPTRVHPVQYVEERKRHDALLASGRTEKIVCPDFRDYRINFKNNGEN